MWLRLPDSRVKKMKLLLMLLFTVPFVFFLGFFISGATAMAQSSPGTAVVTVPQTVAHSTPGQASSDRLGPRRDNLQSRQLAGSHLRMLIGVFEQGAGFPFGIELTTANAIPAIEFRARALVSTRLYRRLEVGGFIPRLGDERTHLDLWAGCQMRTRDNLFGIGPRTPLTPETNYASEERSLNAVLSRDLGRGVVAGLYGYVARSTGRAGTERGTNDLPITRLFPGTTPELSLPGLDVTARLAGIGTFIESDRRDNRRGLTRGSYLYARFASIDSLKRSLLTDFGWREAELDGRGYLPIAGDSTSLALRSLLTLRSAKGGSLIPFYELSWMGGRNQHRGFRNFRYRANNLLLLSIEPRQTVWKKSETRGLDIFVFGDAGQVWGDTRRPASPKISENNRFASANWRYGVGGGVQYRLNSNLAFRLDLGRSPEAKTVFFSVSRGF